MIYDKTLLDDDGEEYPYSESITDDGYHYRISVVFDGKDGELSAIDAGTDLKCDDGTWLDFNIAPERLFPDQNKLSEDDLRRLLGFLCSDRIKHRRRLYSGEQVKEIHAEFEEYLKAKQ